MSDTSEEDFFYNAIRTNLPEAYRLDGESTTLVVEAFCKIKPPTFELPEIKETTDFVRIFDTGKDGGSSIKPGNILLNWRQLFGALPGMVLTGVGAMTNPWLIVLGALVIWKDLYSTARIELEPRHAIAFKAMWDNHDGRNRISEDDAEKFTNSALSKADENSLSTANFARVLDDLSKIGCIEIKSGEIWLREWIRRKWP